jgi:hypothetical protein
MVRTGGDAGVDRKFLVGWSLVVGGIVYAIFWGASVPDVDKPQIVALPLHGLAIALLTIGLVLRQWMAPDRGAVRIVGWVGVIIAVAGLFVAVPLIGLGFLIVGGTAGLTRTSLAGGASLALGAVLLLIAYLLGARYGTEGVPDPEATIAALFLIGWLLTGAGLVMIGLRETRSRAEQPGPQGTKA